VRLIILLVITNVLGMNTYANTPKTPCNSVIKACDKALSDKETVIKQDQEALQKSQEQIKALKDEVKAKDGQLGNLLRQPPVLVGVGVLSTLLGGPIAGIAGLILASSILR